MVECKGGSELLILLLTWFNIWLRSGVRKDGGGREADRVDEIFPLWMTCTVQKSGAPFNTLPGMSFALNLLVHKLLNLDFEIVHN